jgi:hypothetical protein
LKFVIAKASYHVHANPEIVAYQEKIQLEAHLELALSLYCFLDCGLLQKGVGLAYLEPNSQSMQNPKRGRSVLAFSTAISMLKSKGIDADEPTVDYCLIFTPFK